MTILQRITNSGIVPVVVIDELKDALPTADALFAGGIDVMEITLRTAAGLDAIKAVSANRPDLLVGAGTVLTVDQCKACVEAGAKFIVSPGFDVDLVRWCMENNVAVTPGCVTPSEITQALSMSVKVVKFFPSNVYGGLSAMKSLAAPFGGVKFIPTGGIDGKNLCEYISAPFVHAVGGSWICTKADIAAGNFDKITTLCKEARGMVLGFEFGHLGINTPDEGASIQVCKAFNTAFGFPTKEGASSNFSSSAIEVMKSKYLGEHGHIAIKTNDIARAISYLQKKGLAVDMETAKYKGDKLIAVYLTQEFGGFAIHLLQK